MGKLEQALHEYYSLGINQQIDYDKFYLYSIIQQQNVIWNQWVQIKTEAIKFSKCTAGGE